jgi:hypothetical protein
MSDSRRPASGLEYFERTLARAIVIAGSSFWVIAAFAGHYLSRTVTLQSSILTATGPFLGTLATIVIGWRHERLASTLLFVAAAAMVVWGVIYGWEAGVWAVMSYAVIAPLAIAGMLFALAARAKERRTTEGPQEQDPVA